MTACYRRSFTPDSEAAFRLLIAAGADINARDNEGRTPLMYAVQGYIADEAWLRLMSAKPDIHARDNSGKQAIDYTKPGSNNYRRLLAPL